MQALSGLGRQVGGAAILVVLSGLGSGCYRAHERAEDAGARVDAGLFIPRCDPRGLTGTGCTDDAPDLSLAILRGTVTVEGQLMDYCFCAPGTCRPYDRRSCTSRYLAGDTEHLVCAETIPPGRELGGHCLRECEDASDCLAGMACLDVSEVLGRPYDMDRACFDVLPHVDE